MPLVLVATLLVLAFTPRPQSPVSVPVPVTPSPLAEVPSPGPDPVEVGVPPPTPTQAPSPIPEDTPALVESGLLCTSTADDFALVDTDCLEEYSLLNVTKCEDWRTEITWSCVTTMCIPAVLPVANASFIVWIGLPGFSTNFSTSALISPIAGEPYMMRMVARFMEDNRPETTFPSYLGITPFPRPLTQPLIWDDTAYLNDTRFETPALELARQSVAALLNAYRLDYSFIDIGNATAIGDTFYSLVYTPARCSTLPLNTIPWILDNTVRVANVVFSLPYLLNWDMNSSVADPENWDAVCAMSIGDYLPIFCQQFPSYYSYTSLRDFNERPSPYVDAAYLFQAFSEDYQGCGVPRGCTGVLAPPP